MDLSNISLGSRKERGGALLAVAKPNLSQYRRTKEGRARAAHSCLLCQRLFGTSGVSVIAARCYSCGELVERVPQHCSKNGNLSR